MRYLINTKYSFMKIISFSLMAIFSSTYSLAQVMGNINYQSQVIYPASNIDLAMPNNANVTIVVKGLANVVADNYVAIFSLTQAGKTTAEATNLIDTRIDEALIGLKGKPGVTTYIDMISFVPIYDYEVEKKVFSKKTYNEIPKGFELKKNIHIKYNNPNLLNEIIANLASKEIYDLVRVDYYAENMETVKTDLINKAKLLLQDKIKSYKQIIGNKLDSAERRLVDGFKIVYPVEQYKAYQAYANSELILKKSANINQAEKSTTMYYQPIVNKEFDFVINPIILEPVIQILYEIKVEVDREKAMAMQQRDYYLITTTGDIKRLKLDK